MNKLTLIILMALIFSSCGAGQSKPSKKSLNNIEDCLENQSGFIQHKPENIYTFIEVMSKSSVKCKAERFHVKEYAKRVIQEYGDL